MLTEPAFASQIGLFLTYRCPIRCRHCMVNAGPHRTEEVDLAEGLFWVEEIAAYRGGYVTSIGFTGGEPFACWDKLRVLGKAAAEMGLACSVITNAYWANTAERTRRMLEELAPTDVSVSTDEFHAEFIPLENIGRVFDECLALGIRCDLTVAFNQRSPSVTWRLLDRLLTFAPRSAMRLTKVFPAGRGREISSFSEQERPIEPASSRPCLFASVPYILPDGQVRPCVGPIITLPSKGNPLSLGSLREANLEEILDASFENPILQGVRLWGPGFLHALVERNGPNHRLPRAYNTNCPCEVCLTLLSDPEICHFLLEAVVSAELTAGVSRARAKDLNEAGPERLI